ncbi:D-amino acid dehydrogenase small subunit [Neorhodopirellula lusitana]|uniref:D-amino acid dehydrogenase small subunit n=1 Tax=Neorhodopirellula lusitana TaxID=445327 RepID=A0ABY1QFD1_9BACT|nr:FAD-dependent oxidoreductase [Neorhodopirellula lusitana]SMP69699.1 D-amino acid dehydrogenase small subunit [Neorhodopirellula lusitana]
MPRESDSVTIVGAGIVGITCAHYLEQAGFRVTVLDQGKVASACSMANCGYICPSHALPLTEPGAFRVAISSMFNRNSPFRVKPQLSPAVWKWMFQFAKRCTHEQMLAAGKPLQAILESSMSEYHQLISEFKLDCEWKEDGLLYVLQTQRGMDHFAATDKIISDNFGIAAQRIDGDALPEFDSGLKPGLAGAYLYPGDTSVRPDKLNAALTFSLRSRGVRFVEGCELKSVRKEAGRVVALETSKGEFASDQFVFAFGAWASKWESALQCSIPVQPGKGYSVTMGRTANAPKHPILFPEHKVGVSPFDQGLRLGSMMEFAGYDRSIPDRRIQQLRDSARPYLVASVDGPAESKWFGWRPMTWDSLPIIGLAGDLRNAYLATGHNMLGLSLAPGTGRLIAEMMTGQKTHLPSEPYSPSRF